MNACSTTFLCLCFSLAPSLHYVSYTTHTITNYTQQPTHVLYLASCNYLAPLYHAFNATINPPTTSSITSSLTAPPNLTKNVAATAIASHRRPRQVPCHEASMNVQASFISMLLPHVTMCPTKCGNSKRFKSHHQSTQNHHGQQCREPHHGQPQNGYENATYLLRTTPPPPSVASAAAAAPMAATANASHLDCRQPWLPQPPLSP